MVAAERWIVHRGFALVGAEAGEEGRVGVELLGAAVQLPGAAEIHQAAIVHAVHCAAQLNIFAAQRSQIANIACVFGQTGDGEAAVCVAGLGAAGIEKPRAIAELGDLVDMCRDADVFAAVADCF